MNPVLYAITVLSCIAGLWNGWQIRQYFRRTHPDIWSKFGFEAPGGGRMTAGEADERWLAGYRAFSRFCRSKEFLDLHDPRLHRMIRANRVLKWIFLLSVAAVLASWGLHRFDHALT
jgi:hypothetical protein